MSTARHQQTDGWPAVVNRMVEHFIRCYCDYKQDNWYLLLQAAMFVYNSTRSEYLGAIPFEIGLGLKPKNPIDVLTVARPRVGAVEECKDQLKCVLEDEQYAHEL